MNVLYLVAAIVIVLIVVIYYYEYHSSSNSSNGNNSNNNGNNSNNNGNNSNNNGNNSNNNGNNSNGNNNNNSNGNNNNNSNGNNNNSNNGNNNNSNNNGNNNNNPVTPPSPPSPPPPPPPPPSPPYSLTYLQTQIPLQWNSTKNSIVNFITNMTMILAAYNQLNSDLTGQDLSAFRAGQYSSDWDQNIIAHVAPGKSDSKPYQQVNNLYKAAAASLSTLLTTYTTLDASIAAFASLQSPTASNLLSVYSNYTSLVALLPAASTVSGYLNTGVSLNIALWVPPTTTAPNAPSKALFSITDTSSFYSIWLWLSAYNFMLNSTANIDSGSWLYGTGSQSNPATLGYGGWQDIITVNNNVKQLVAGGQKQLNTYSYTLFGLQYTNTLSDYIDDIIGNGMSTTISGWYTNLLNDIAAQSSTGTSYAALEQLLLPLNS